MYGIAFLGALLGLSSFALAQREDGQFWPCNPIKNNTGACPPNPGLLTSKYEIDFTKIKAIPKEWTVSDYATINFGPDGAEFTYNKRYDAPQLWTNFFIFFGKVEIEMRVANGTGMISSAVLMSDDFDEIDFEFSGNNFGFSEAAAGIGQNNYFGKGITENYDRGLYFDVSEPQETFHTYSVEWRKANLKWGLDGRTVRTHEYIHSSGDSGSYQYPQTPSRFQLGIWAGGDPGQNAGTKAWAGGETDVNGGPYTMFVRKVTIHNYNPAYAYNWTDQSGKWQSIQLLKSPDAAVGKASSSVKPSSTSTKFSSTSSQSSSSSAVSSESSSTSVTNSRTSSSSSAASLQPSYETKSSSSTHASYSTQASSSTQASYSTKSSSSTTSTSSTSECTTTSKTTSSTSSTPPAYQINTPKPTTRTITTTKRVTSTSMIPAGYGSKPSTTTKVLTYTSTYRLVGTSTVKAASTKGLWGNWRGWTDGWWTTDAHGRMEYVGGRGG
ncbi:Putative glycoside hydrolase family 16, concanavalin A-like lectin/glucanase domain superfamily [Septoria linicola]|uniref:chitinase n=1 Tax=Septoria linicola TaxID=215465 RepID=A0A9Q9EHT0_9PEZI|nr:Putative glycoside hydrolase family 16, concanavalin A-like lectin/glucanase domain superfamily [Septoria linicola]